jgi:hypothetical protein
MTSAEDVKQYFRKSTLSTKRERHEAIFEKILCAYNQSEKAEPISNRLDIRSIFMKNPITKIAIAAVVVIACLTGVLVFNKTSSIALGEVLDRIEQVEAYCCRMSAVFSNKDIEDMPVSQSKMLISQTYGSKMNIEINHPLTGESSTLEIYILPPKGTITTLMPNEKKYSQVHYDKETAERSGQGMDPHEMLKQILDCEHTSLGLSTIDGIECKGFETTDPDYAGGSLGQAVIRIWVNINTKLPVRMEVNKGNEQTGFVQIALTNFEWDVPVDDGDFEPVIPEDYTPGQPMLQMLPPAK